MMKSKIEGVSLRKKALAQAFLDNLPCSPPLHMVRLWVEHGEAMLRALGKPLLGAELEITTPAQTNSFDDEPNAAKIRLVRYKDDWHMTKLEPHVAGFCDFDSVVIIEPESEMTLGKAIEKSFADRRSKIEAALNGRPIRFEHVTSHDGDFQAHLPRVFQNRVPTPSPEARTLDAIRALYEAADDAGSKVQSAVAHAHETALSLGKSESADKIAAISRQIEQLKAACREAVETLAVSGK